MPIVDMHFHPSWEWDLDETVQALKEAGVIRAGNGALVYDDEYGSDRVALEFVRLHPETFFAFGGQVGIRELVLHQGESAWELRSEAAAEYLDEIKQGLREGQWAGIGELFVHNLNTHPASDFVPSAFPPDSPLMGELWQLSADFSVPLSVHMQAEEEYVARMENLLASDRRGVWLWAHTGYYAQPSLLRRLFDDHPNLYAELSWRDGVRESVRGTPIDDDGVLRPQWAELLENYSGRFVIGTDVTVGSIDEYRAVIRYWRDILDQLPAEAAGDIAYRNAEWLLRGPDGTP